MLRFQKIVGYIIAGLLAFTAALKLAAAFQSDPILLKPDSILLVENRALLIAVSAVEILVAISIFREKNIAAKQATILWLVACFGVYRIALWIGNYSKPCACLGTGLSWWPWLSAHEAGASLTAFWFLATCAMLYKYSGSLANLLFQRTTGC
ncbi:MAG TPA: MauE/DoxX family redox-associated membrane protein [Opitutus sp.]|nr:MauE/DoxX family redox-associated membrane protein [Opitutus sp.]